MLIELPESADATYWLLLQCLYLYGNKTQATNAVFDRKCVVCSV